MEKIEVSFITLCFNRFSQLNACVRSIIDNTADITYEIMVTDNHSVEGDIEGTFEFLQKVRLYKNDVNMGWPKAINESIRKAKGEFICIVDSDVLFLENSAKILLDFCRHAAEDVITAPRLLNPDGSVQKSISDLNTPLRQLFQAFFFDALFPASSICNFEYMNHRKIEKPCEVRSLMGACLFFKKTVFTRLHGFDSRMFFYGSDTDFCLRFGNLGGKVIYHPGTAVIHLGGASSGAVSAFAARMFSLDMIEFYKKHFRLQERMLIHLFSGLGLMLRVPLRLFYGLLSRDSDSIKKSYYQWIKLVYLVKGVFGYAGRL